MAEKALPADNDRGPMLLAITWTTAAVATMIVILRVYSRTVLQNTMGWDDAAIIAALVGISLSWLPFFSISRLMKCITALNTTRTSVDHATGS